MKYLLLSICVCVCSSVFSGEMAMNHSMDHGMGDLPMPGAWKDTDEAGFLYGMLEHHIGAVEMAEAVVDTAQDAGIRKWARNIIADQNKEIDLMRSMIAERNYTDPGAGAAMKAEMQRMMAMEMSKNADVNFIQMMIPHHAGAIVMAAPALVGTTDMRIRTLAKNIIEAQTREIAEFRDWLDKHHE